jgi:hypothetical protein
MVIGTVPTEQVEFHPQRDVSHVCVPRSVARPQTVHVCDVRNPPHAKVSSALPLQLLSRPSHVSVCAARSPTHAVDQRPPSHICTPGRHSPVDDPQARERFSSTAPSQSSSRPLQVSVAGSLSPTHAPNIPALHICVPARQAPTSRVAAGPV